MHEVRWKLPLYKSFLFSEIKIGRPKISSKNVLNRKLPYTNIYFFVCSISFETKNILDFLSMSYRMIYIKKSTISYQKKKKKPLPVPHNWTTSNTFLNENAKKRKKKKRNYFITYWYLKKIKNHHPFCSHTEYNRVAPSKQPDLRSQPWRGYF